MELEELKTTWDTEQLKYSRQAIYDIFEIKTKRSIKSINQTMFVDYALMLIAAALLIALAFFLGLKSRYMVTLEILVVTAIMIIHYGIKYRLLNSIDLHAEDLRKALEKLTKRLSLYLMAYRVIIPLFASIIYLKTQWNLLTIRHMSLTEGIWEIALVIPIALVSFWLVHKLSMKMYGQQLEQLKALKQQLTHRFE